MPQKPNLKATGAWSTRLFKVESPWKDSIILLGFTIHKTFSQTLFNLILTGRPEVNTMMTSFSDKHNLRQVMKVVYYFMGN
jgi:hypothetical protein